MWITISLALAQDTDLDGIDDVDEVAAGTNPNASDSDFDGIPDGEEWFNWLRPDAGLPSCVAPYSGLSSDPAVKPQFTPGTGWSCAFPAGFLPQASLDDKTGGTTGGSVGDPWDRDGDGVINAMDPDDDGDGLSTFDEGLADIGEICPQFGADPTNPGDGVPAYLDFDSDGDGLPDDTVGDGLSSDTDLDGVVDAVDCEDSGPLGDSDLDGVANWDEVNQGTNMLQPDTDGDSVPDGPETSEDDTDKDGIIDALDEDDDNDGTLTIDEADWSCASGAAPGYGFHASAWGWWCDGNGTPAFAADTDGDGIVDYLDAVDDPPAGDDDDDDDDVGLDDTDDAEVGDDDDDDDGAQASPKTEETGCATVGVAGIVGMAWLVPLLVISSRVRTRRR